MLAPVCVGPYRKGGEIPLRSLQSVNTINAIFSTMVDASSEEFKKFILENRDIIQSILDEGKKPEKEEDKTPKEAVDEKLEETKAKLKNLNSTMLSIVGDDEVQKHFITGCLEFLHFFEALIDAAPLSPEVREVVDGYEDTLDKTVRNVVVTGVKDKMGDINVEEPKPKNQGRSTKKKVETISIREVKKDS